MRCRAQLHCTNVQGDFGCTDHQAEYFGYELTRLGASGYGQSVLATWPMQPGGDDPEGVKQDNAVLDHWFTNKLQYSVRDSEFDVIYVNGDNNLENMKRPNERWKVRLIEEDFHRLMFDTDGMP